jgi:spermidine synthase
METLDTLARHLGPRGEVVLRRRNRSATAVEELIVNGVFAMDSADTETERRLAEIALGGPRARRVLVGGLGLGYTAAELLAGGVEQLDVVEIEECLVGWAYDGLTPTLAGVARDPRVALHPADVAAVLTGRRPEPRGPWDAILLDVDNGPDFLIHETNAGLYTAPLLAAAYARLTDGGTLAIWSQGPAPDLLTALGRLSPTARPHAFSRVRDGRTLDYVIYTATRAAAVAFPAEQECGP